MMERLIEGSGGETRRLRRKGLPQVCEQLLSAVLARQLEEHREGSQPIRCGADESLGPLFEVPPDPLQVVLLTGMVESK